jgi:hypothetical protein
MHDHIHVDESRERRQARRRAWPALAALACLAVLAAACGSASSNSTSDTGAGSPGGSPSSSALAYSQCMRAHGITKFPDPNSQGGLSLRAGPGTGIDPNSPQFKAADQACRKLMPGSNLSPAQRAANQAREIRYSQCMRAHGLPDFPDPNSQGGIAIKGQPGSDLDPNNPRFRAASSACQHIMAGSGKGGSLTTNGGPGGGS